MSILLTHTYFIAEDPAEQKVMKPYPPLGLLYLSAWLKQHQIAVEVFDSTFSDYQTLEKTIRQSRPKILGIHCNLLTKFTVMKLIRLCNELNIIALLGGPDAATQVEEFLQYGADIIIAGEGEDALLNVIKHFESGDKHSLHHMSNVAFKDASGKIIETKREASKRHLDEFPLPDREAINFELYLDTWEKYHGQRSASLITARGCAFTCKWCSHSVYGWTHRRRKPEQVLLEIQWLIEHYGITHLWFADDVFTVNKRWLQKFHRCMKSAGINLPFECISRADRLDEEMVILLKELGCYRIWFGAESGSQKILDAMSRGVTRTEIANATQWCQKHNLQAGYFVMFGYPGEELEDIYQTIEFVEQQQPDIYLTTVAYPLRGTTLYDEIHPAIRRDSDWEHHLQRELGIEGRFRDQLYQFAIRKLASDYRKRQLNGAWQKKIYHFLRSFYCDWQIQRLARQRT